MLAQILHECLCERYCDLVCLITVVAERHIFALFNLIVDSKTALVAYDADATVLHCSDRVGNDRQTSDTGSTCALYISVVKRHLKRLIVVLVVHVVDNLQSVDISLSQPTHHLLELRHELLVCEVITSDRSKARSNLLARHLVTTTIDSIEHTLSEVSTSTEELHLLTNLHRRYAACDTVVVAEISTHKVVVLILDSACVDTYLSTIFLPCLRQALAPKHSKVRFWRRTHIVESVEETIVGLCNHRTAVDAHTTNRSCSPNRVA